MFDSIIATIRGIAQGIWDAAIRAGTTVWGIVVALIGIVTSLLNTVNTWIESLVTTIADIVIPSTTLATGTIGSILGLANRIYPLSELCVQLAAWGALCAVLMVYHVIKSWLPTVAAS